MTILTHPNCKESKMQLNEIIEKIKDILSNEQDTKVLDKDVAAALLLSKDSLSHMKRKNAIPYEHGNIELLSDNTSYSPELICKDEMDGVLILGKVLCSLDVDDEQSGYNPAFKK